MIHVEREGRKVVAVTRWPTENSRPAREDDPDVLEYKDRIQQHVERSEGHGLAKLAGVDALIEVIAEELGDLLPDRDSLRERVLSKMR